MVSHSPGVTGLLRPKEIRWGLEMAESAPPTISKKYGTIIII